MIANLTKVAEEASLKNIVMEQQNLIKNCSNSLEEVEGNLATMDDKHQMLQNKVDALGGRTALLETGNILLKSIRVGCVPTTAVACTSGYHTLPPDTLLPRYRTPDTYPQIPCPHGYPAPGYPTPRYPLEINGTSVTLPPLNRPMSLKT